MVGAHPLGPEPTWAGGEHQTLHPKGFKDLEPQTGGFPDTWRLQLPSAPLSNPQKTAAICSSFQKCQEFHLGLRSGRQVPSSGATTCSLRGRT